jgi:hypothetical protein
MRWPCCSLQLGHRLEKAVRFELARGTWHALRTCFTGTQCFPGAGNVCCDSRTLSHRSTAAIGQLLHQLQVAVLGVRNAHVSL